MLVGVQNSMTIREIRMGFSKKLKLSHNPGIGHIPKDFLSTTVILAHLSSLQRSQQEGIGTSLDIYQQTNG